MQGRNVLGDLAATAQRLEQTLQRWIAEGWVQPFSDTAWLKAAFASDDLTLQPVATAGGGLEIAYLAPQIDVTLLNSDVGAPLIASSRSDPRRDLPNAMFVTQRSDVLTALLQGKAAVFKPGAPDAALVDVRVNRSRSINQPSTEASLLGPKVAFNEDFTTSLNLVRNLLATPALRVREHTIGTLSRTRVATVWIDGVTAPDLVDEVLDRLSKVTTDTLLSSEDLAQIAFHRSWTPFPTAQRTERPDRVARALGLGRIAIIVDGSPFVILLPVTLGAITKYLEALFGPPVTIVFVRWLRFVGGFMSMVAPAAYVAVLSINPSLLPADTLVAVAQTRAGVPYPVLFETIGLLLILDMVIEASQQAPSPIGQTVTVVGGLIIGQAAVQAHLGSQLIVIVSAVTGIGTLLIPDISLAYAIRITKYPVMVMAGILGFYGLTLCLIAIAIHLVAQESLDAPYATPFGPVRPGSLTSYTLMAKQRGARTLRPVTYGPVTLRRQPRGGMKD